MSLIPCPVCNKPCSSLAVSCPRCGHPLANNKDVVNLSKSSKRNFFSYLRNQNQKSKKWMIVTIVMSIVAISLLSFAIYKTVKKPKCSLTIEQAPSIAGIKLRMSREEVKALFPSYIIPSSNEVSIENPSKLPGIEEIMLTFENNRVKRFSVNYQDNRWRNLTEFIDDMREKLNLQYLASEEKEPSQFESETVKTRIIHCKDFSVGIGGFYLGGGLKSNYRVDVSD